MPQVTVVIPTFNCAAYLPQAVESVLLQSFADFEIIVVDDGSVDNTREVMERYASDSRIHYVFQENSGLPAARNTGVRHARGEFIAALDADDLLAANALQAMYNALRASGASWCIIDVLKFWENFREVQRTELPAGGDWLHAMFRDDFIRRAMFLEVAALKRVGLWDAEMKMREDWDLNIRLIEAREPYIYLAEPLYQYRKRPDSITTGNPDRLFHYTEQVLRKHARRYADAGDQVAARLYAENLWDLGRQHLYRRRDPRSALRCMCESFRYDFKPSRLLHAVRHNLLPARS